VKLMANSPAEIIDLEKINLGDHAVLFYRKEVNMLNTAAAYIKNSLENDEKCIYIDTEPMHEKIIELLKRDINHLNYYLNSNQLLLLTKEESYGNPSEFDADAMIDLITVEVKKALKAGYKGLSITGELKGVVDFHGGKEEVIKYEWKLSNMIFKKYPVSALCRYNLDQFDSEVIKAAIELHDYIVWKGRLNDNPYFIDPQGYKENKIEEYEIKSWLENIDQYHKREKNYKKIIDRTKEELSASNQQLQAYNEEMMAMNEELEDSFLELENLNNRFEKMISLISDIENLNTINEEEFLSKILKQAVEIIPEADFGSIYTFGEKYVDFVDCIGYDLAELQSRKIKNEAFYNQQLPIEIIDTSKIKERNKDYMDGSEFKKLKKNSLNKSKEIMYLDLEVNGLKKAGISLDIAKESSQEFSHNSKKLFAAFYNIASSFYKLKEYNSLQDNFTREIISSTIKMLEMYDLYTRGHSENVAELAVKIAEAMDLSKP
jgi:HD-GYP domain-containing protein (c-di-GMP phosphodiesterase class II)